MNPLRPPSIPGIRFFSSRDAGTCVVHQFAFIAGQKIETVTALLQQLQPGHEVSMEAYCPGEAYLEIRRVGVQLQLKKSHHGSSGAWAAATFAEAQEYLSPVAPYIDGSSPHFKGFYTI